MPQLLEVFHQNDVGLGQLLLRKKHGLPIRRYGQSNVRLSIQREGAQSLHSVF
jgi:hypothetical protein